MLKNCEDRYSQSKTRIDYPSLLEFLDVPATCEQNVIF